MAQERTGVRVAEVLASLSLATDLGIGQPMEHVLRQTLLSLRLGEHIGLDEADRATLYHLGLLAWVGCSADAFEMARMFGDEIAFKGDSYDFDLTGLAAFGFMIRHVGSGRSPLRRARTAASLLLGGGKSIDEMMRSHCELAGTFASRLGLGAEVQVPLGQVFERWDGKGTPGRLRGDAIALSARIVALADVAVVFHRRGGAVAALDVARERSGTMFDPALVDLLGSHADDLFDNVDASATWDTVIGAEPGLRGELDDDGLDRTLEAVADFVDLKSPYTAGHSLGVAALAAAAAERVGLPASDVALVRRAGLVHDLGRLGISNAIWDKTGPLTAPEQERVRLHPYLTERMLAQSPGLAKIGAVAMLHHERLDGSGYHRGLTADSIPATARILAAADVYHAMLEPRPHRDARSPDDAAAELRAEARASRLDGPSVDAVLQAAGHRVRRRPAQPAGLTPREVEVLELLARGTSNREVGRLLRISPKTVGSHVEHIYTKTGVSTRAGATLFATRHGLLDPFARDESGLDAS
jgi:HD-GYP domain-containing protein (c-di-GMP phosphodiesterase class II)